MDRKISRKELAGLRSLEEIIDRRRYMVDSYVCIYTYIYPLLSMRIRERLKDR